MANTYFHAKLLVDVFCNVLSTIDRTMATTCTAKTNLHVGKAALLKTGDVEIDDFVHALKEGENLAICFKKIDDWLI